MCHFENVCWVDDRIFFYEDPELRQATPDFLWPESFNARADRTLVYLGYPEGTDWSPEIETGPLPRGVSLDASSTFLLNENSHSDNFGHILFDDLIPGLQALSVFNFPLDSGLLLSLSACVETTPHYAPYQNNPYENKPRRDVCLENYRTYAPAVLGREMVDVRKEWKGKTICMRNLIAGFSSAFSLGTLDMERAPSLRWARDRIAKSLGLSRLPRPQTQRVLVLSKKPGFQGGPTWPTLCEDTKAAIMAIDPSVAIDCFDPIQQKFEDQVKTSLQSTLIIAEHGTTSYGALYGHDGIVLLSIGDRALLKEVQVNLYATHFDTYYMAHENKGEQFEGMVRFALAKAASNFGFARSTRAN